MQKEPPPDTVPAGQSFGCTFPSFARLFAYRLSCVAAVAIDASPSYSRGQTALVRFRLRIHAATNVVLYLLAFASRQATFWGASPRNDLMTEQTFMTGRLTLCTLLYPSWCTSAQSSCTIRTRSSGASCAMIPAGRPRYAPRTRAVLRGGESSCETDSACFVAVLARVQFHWKRIGTSQSQVGPRSSHLIQALLPSCAARTSPQSDPSCLCSRSQPSGTFPARPRRAPTASKPLATPR